MSKTLSEVTVKAIFCMLVGSILIGCSGLPEQAQLAQKNEWYDVGILDGKLGHYQRAKFELKQLNVLTNSAYEEYKKGYAIGLEKFCSPDYAYEHGIDGVEYQGQCANTAQEEVAIQRWSEGYQSFKSEMTMIAKGY